MEKRLLQLPKNNSFLLFGPRGCGKTTLLNAVFTSKKTIWIDLLRPATLDKYQTNPDLLIQEIEGLSSKEKPSWIIIDEVQKIPKLLDVVHFLIEKYKINFALTGSSSRRLKQQSTNLLAGRAWVSHLYPFSFSELPQKLQTLDYVLNWGGLPQLLKYSKNSDREEYLRAYVYTYLEKEIQTEQWIKKLEPFRKFLPIAAQMNGKILNFEKIAKDVLVDSKTIKNYYEILEDTLLGFYLPAFDESIRKQIRKAPKFYFIDRSLQRALEKNFEPLAKQTGAWGIAFEHWLMTEIYKMNVYKKRNYELSYIMTKSNKEIDLVLRKPNKELIFIEIKSKNAVNEDDCKTLEFFVASESKSKSKAYLFSTDPISKKIGSVHCLYWQKGLDILGLS